MWKTLRNFLSKPVYRFYYKSDDPSSADVTASESSETESQLEETTPLPTATTPLPTATAHLLTETTPLLTDCTNAHVRNGLPHQH